MTDPKDDLRRYLQTAREAMLWKLDGLGEYDARRPLTPTGTNLLGLVKHLAFVESGYFGETFERPFDEPALAYDDAEDPTMDMWARADESREFIVDLYRRVWAHSDATIDATALTDTGRVAHWPDDRATVTLHRILVHVIAETHRHAGHADILRESLDGLAGLRADNDNLWTPDDGLAAQHSRLDAVAREAAGLT